MEDIIEEIEEEFKPKPGGMVDRHRQNRAAREAAQHEKENTDTPIEQRAYKAVKTAAQSPEIVSAATFNIAPGNAALILPMSPYRYRATILLVAQPGLSSDTAAAIAAGVPTVPAIPLGAALTGFAVTLSGPDANVLALTVSNGINTIVQHYDIAPGQTSLMVMFPFPVPPSVVASAVLLTATATATGFLTVFYTTNDLLGEVILAKDQGAAISGNGFSLPFSVPLTVFHRGMLYASNPLSQLVQVSVMSEIYAPEQ